MKNFVSPALLFLGIGGRFIYNGIQQLQLQTQQLAGYDRQVSQLLSQIEKTACKDWKLRSKFNA